VSPAVPPSGVPARSVGRGGKGDGFGQTFAVKSLRGVLRGKCLLTSAVATANS